MPLVHRRPAVVRKIIKNGFDKPFQMCRLFISEIGKYRFWRGEKCKEDGEEY